MRRIDSLLDDHLQILTGLAPTLGIVERVAERMRAALTHGGTVWWMGNGGSAAMALHLAAELVGRFELQRAGLRSAALCADIAALTAIANDFGYETLFERQVNALCREGDVLVGMTTSGRSPNILRGFEAGQAKGVYRVALTGEDAGVLDALCDACLTVPSRSAARIQEAHLFLGHALCAAIERDLGVA